MRKTLSIRNVSVLTILLSTVFWQLSASYSQTFPDDNAEALKGVGSFDAIFMVMVWLDSSEDQSRFQENGQAAFELALRRDGVVVDSGAPNYLLCKASIAESSSGLVFYVWDLEYYLYRSDAVHLLAWESGGISTVGKSNFSAEELASDCADSFANTWLAQNPK